MAVSVRNVADDTLVFEFTCSQWALMSAASQADWTVTENTCGIQTTVGNPYAASDFLFTLNGVVAADAPITIDVVDGVYTIGIDPATGTLPGSMSALDYLKAQTYLEPVSKNTIAVAIPAGAVTSITVTDALAADEYATGDVFSVINNANGERVKLTVTANTGAGATTISATGTAATEIPIGGIIVPIYSVRDFLPTGSTGDYLYFNGTEWVAAPFDEDAQDAVGDMILDTDTVNLTYTDGTPSLKADVVSQMSITADASGLKLSGDSAAPGNTKLYGTDGAGVKGWYAQPSGGGGLSDGDYGDITVSVGGTVMDIDPGVVGTTELTDLNVTTGKLADNAVTTVKITDDAVTLAKLQNAVAGNIVLGNIGAAGAIYAELTVANLYTLLGMTGTPNRIAIWGGANNLASDVSYVVDAGAGTMTIQATSPGLGAGLGTLNVNATNFTGSCSYITAVGNVTQNLNFEFRNTNTGATANTLFQIGQAGSAAGDAAIQLRITGVGGADYAVGIDNSDAKKFKITPNSATPGGVGNSGIVMTHAAVSLVGINKDAPAHPLDVAGRARSNEFIGIGTDKPTVGTLGNGLGTGPVINDVSGTNNGFIITFTTGTAPVAGGNMFVVTYKDAYPGFSIPVFCQGNDDAANEFSKFSFNGINGANFTMKVRAGQTLTASKQYVLNFAVNGF